jgi:hypothetical protein
MLLLDADVEAGGSCQGEGDPELIFCGCVGGGGGVEYKKLGGGGSEGR